MPSASSGAKLDKSQTLSLYFHKKLGGDQLYRALINSCYSKESHIAWLKRYGFEPIPINAQDRPGVYSVHATSCLLAESRTYTKPLAS